VLTVAAVAAQKGIALDKIDVQVKRETVEGTPWRTSFAIQINCAGPPGEELSHREQIILFNSAHRCEVHKLLSGEMKMDYQYQG